MRQILWQGHMTIQRLKTLLGKKEVIDGLILTTYYMIRPYHALCTAQKWKSHRANLMDIDSICGPTKINHHFNPHKSNFLKLTFLTLALRKSHFFWTNPSCLKPSSFNYHKLAELVLDWSPCQRYGCDIFFCMKTSNSDLQHARWQPSNSRVTEIRVHLCTRHGSGSNTIHTAPNSDFFFPF